MHSIDRLLVAVSVCGLPVYCMLWTIISAVSHKAMYVYPEELSSTFIDLEIEGDSKRIE